MGAAKRRRDRFFRDHPKCCFCGGEVKAETQDHWPGRGFFSDRRSPDQFVFPACQPCNSASQTSETVLQLIAASEERSDQDQARWRATVEYVRRHHPALIKSLRMDNRAKRNAVTQLGLAKPPGVTFAEVPIVALDPDRWNPHIELFGRKLLLSLHYQCFGRPITSAGGVSFVFETNTTIGPGSLTEKFLELTDQLAIPAHQSRRLGDQFSIRWSHGFGPDIAIWAVHLHSRLFYLGISAADRAMAQLHDRPIFGPLVHDSQKRAI